MALRLRPTLTATQRIKAHFTTQIHSAKKAMMAFETMIDTDPTMTPYTV